MKTNETKEIKENKTLTLSPSLVKEVESRLKKNGGKFSYLVESLLSEWIKSYDITDMAMMLVQAGEKDPEKIAKEISKKLNNPQRDAGRKS